MAGQPARELLCSPLVLTRLSCMNISRYSRCCAGAAALGVVLLLNGCGKVDKEATPTPSTNSAKVNPRDVPMADADLLNGVAVGKNAAPMTPAEKAWEDLQQALQPPSFPPEWETNPPAKEALAVYQKQQGDMAAGVADKVTEFLKQFPKSEHVEQARSIEGQLLNVAAQLGNTNAAAKMAARTEARLKDPNTPEEERFQLRVEQLQSRFTESGETNHSKMLTAMEKGVREVQKEFPARPEGAALLLGLAEEWLEQGNLEHALKLAREVATAKDAETKESAAALIKKLERVGQPVAMQFKALDGRDVDLAKLRGKVVLIDFWATWCGPCVKEVPQVKAAYDRLNAKGFEIIGVSLDQERAELEKMIAEKQMTWPQYFEGGEKNKFADEFQVASIPTMWLVDKNGILRDISARENLAAKVEKLLAE